MDVGVTYSETARSVAEVAIWRSKYELAAATLEMAHLEIAELRRELVQARLDAAYIAAVAPKADGNISARDISTISSHLADCGFGAAARAHGEAIAAALTKPTVPGSYGRFF